MRRSLAQFLFAVLAVGTLLVREARVPPLAGAEENFVNWLAANSNGDHAAAPVTLVEINDNCLVNYPWPWSPLSYAIFLDAALEFQARATAIEPVLTWDESKLSQELLLQQPQFEKILHDAILRSPRVELGAELGFPEDPDVLPPMQPMPVFRDVTGAVDAVPEYTVIQAEPEEDMRLTTALGFTNIPATEPAVRHAPLLFRYRGQLVPSFALEAMMLWYGVTPDDVHIRLGSDIRLDDHLAIPINAAGAMLVDWKQPCDRVGFDDLVLAEDQLEGKHATVIDPALLKGRLLVLARTTAQAQTLLLPTGRMVSPGELFAEAIATAETNAFARPAGVAGEIAVLLLGLFIAWVVESRSWFKSGLLLLEFTAGYLLLCLVLFEASRVALPLTPMLGLIAFIAAFRLLAPKVGKL